MATIYKPVNILNITVVVCQMATLSRELGRVFYLHDNTSDYYLCTGRLSKHSSNSRKNNALSLPLAVYHCVFICMSNRKWYCSDPTACHLFGISVKKHPFKFINVEPKPTCSVLSSWGVFNSFKSFHFFMQKINLYLLYVFNFLQQ